MSEQDSTQSAPKALPRSELLKQATELCDELDDLMAMHHFFYRAVEYYFNDGKTPFRLGLSLFPSWLREQDIDVQERVHRLQEALRAAK